MIFESKRAVPTLSKNFFTVLLVVITALLTMGTSASADVSQKRNQVKVPDGLYLYQPYAGDEYSALGSFDKDTLRPLVLIKAGELLDPFVYAKKYGLSSLVEQYVGKQSFDVYLGKKRVGELHDVTMWTCTSGHNFVPDIFAKGDYRGDELPFIPSPKFSGVKLHKGVKAIAVPRNTKMMLKKLPSIGKGEATEIQNSDLDKLIHDAYGPATRMYERVWVDIDNDGVLDAISNIKAAKELVVVYTKRNGLETVSASDGEVGPGIIIGGVIDLDQDGVFEIVVEKELTGPGPSLGGIAHQVEIYKRNENIWQKMYGTAPIWCQP
jgi:hypothetical protein